jgi:uncharacterized membrane protein
MWNSELKMFEQSLIPANQNWLILAALLTIAALGMWSEKTRWGAHLSGSVIIILGAMLLSNVSLIPSEAPVYDMVWTYFVPLAIPLLLFKADLRKIIKETGPTLLAFILGAVGTVVGTVLAFFVIPLGPEGWKLAAIFCATYIGGSMNYVAAAEAVGLKSGGLMTAGVAADMLVMAIYFLVLFALPSIAFFRKRYRARIYDNTDDADSKAAIEQSQDSGKEITVSNMLTALAIAAILCAAGYGIADLTGLKGTGILFLTAFTLLLATLFPKQMGRISGAGQLGMLLMQIFFAVIGASANISIVIKTGPILFVFAALILLVHLLFLLIFGKLFKLDIIEIVIASNANMGGPTTAAAMAAARKWEALVIPAILVGTLGYAIATFIGAAVGYWLK